ncbi:MAG TPA: serine/threonine-protein kinase [Kofleriaceae bacterium]|nr:serine/threonine-protein kinase [Kofleriaceae bacterium]
MSGHYSTGASAPLPTQLGAFQILGVLGEGGSGVVYAARWGHREVALKVLRPALVATERERDQFFTEAKLLSEITHPSVVKVLNFGQLPDGRPYLAMEKLEGETLASRLGRGRFPIADAVTLFAQIIDAVEALHARGLVHRDLKPENVFLVQGGGYAVLLDFGIAKGLDAPASTVTQDGGVRGTPAYMAPERFFGQPATPRTDIYELGVLLYAMLVGRLPWTNISDPESRLNPKTPRELGVELPHALEVELQRALSTRPESRPGSARELLDRIRAASGGVAGGQRRTADLNAPAAPAPAPAYATGAPVFPQQPHTTTPASPAAIQYQLGYAPTMAQQYSTTGDVQPLPGPRSGRPRWPWVVGGAAVAALIAVVVLVVVLGGDKSETVVGQAEAPIAGDPALGAERDPLAPQPLPAVDLSAALGSRTEVEPRFAAAATHHPADTEIIIAIHVEKLLASEAFGEILRGQKKNPELAPLLLIGQMCKVDPFEDVEWMTIGMVPGSKDHMDLMVSGKLDKPTIEQCARDLSKKPAMIWIDDRTAFFTTRDKVDEAWLRARRDGTGSMTGAPAGAGLAAVDRSSTVWFAGKPGDSLGDMSEDLAAAAGLWGGIKLGADVDADLWIEFATKAAATKAATELKKQLDEIPRGLIGTLEATQDGDRVHVRAVINTMITGLLAQMVADEIAKP